MLFSWPENLDTKDAVAGASIVVRDGEKLGNTEYVAELIQQTTGGDLFRIETVEEYPLDHDSLVDQAAEEQDVDFRPELAAPRRSRLDFTVLAMDALRPGSVCRRMTPVGQPVYKKCRAFFRTAETDIFVNIFRYKLHNKKRLPEKIGFFYTGKCQRKKAVNMRNLTNKSLIREF